MTQAVSVPAGRFGEMRVVAPVCAAHFLSHYYMIMLAPVFAFVRTDYGASYTDLALALTSFKWPQSVHSKLWSAGSWRVEDRAHSRDAR